MAMLEVFEGVNWTDARWKIEERDREEAGRGEKGGDGGEVRGGIPYLGGLAVSGSGAGGRYGSQGS